MAAAIAASVICSLASCGQQPRADELSGYAQHELSGGRTVYKKFGRSGVIEDLIYVNPDGSRIDGALYFYTDFGDQPASSWLTEQPHFTPRQARDVISFTRDTFRDGRPTLTEELSPSSGKTRRTIRYRQNGLVASIASDESIRFIGRDGYPVKDVAIDHWTTVETTYAGVVKRVSFEPHEDGYTITIVHHARYVDDDYGPCEYSIELHRDADDRTTAISGLIWQLSSCGYGERFPDATVPRFADDFRSRYGKSVQDVVAAFDGQTLTGRKAPPLDTTPRHYIVPGE
jgi:hypothetical protein